MRLDQYLATKNPDTSRSTWLKHIKAGHVTVNNEVETVGKRDVTEADVIATKVPDVADYSHQTLPILYEDDDVIVINKPAGVLTHDKGAVNEEFTVADFVRPFTTYKADTNRPGIIHRLDRDTSGVILTVKNEAAAKMLQKQFEKRTVKKTYSAVVDGTPKEHEAVIDLPIGRNPKAPSTFRVDSIGKSAQTHYVVIESGPKHSLVELKPRTGRTHQLRVHMNYIGTPIHGDKVYGKAADRLYLHAHQLELTLPDNIHRTFIAPVPPTFRKKASE